MIADQPPIPGNITVTVSTNGVQINWDPLFREDCARNTVAVTYNVTVTRVEGDSEGDVVMTGETSAVVFNLTSNQEYMASVMARTADSAYACEMANYPVLTFSSPSELQSAPTSQQPAYCGKCHTFQ